MGSKKAAKPVQAGKRKAKAKKATKAKGKKG